MCLCLLEAKIRPKVEISGMTENFYSVAPIWGHVINFQEKSD